MPKVLAATFTRAVMLRRLFAAAVVCAAAHPAAGASAQERQPPAHRLEVDSVVTRVVPLYYTRDAARVVALLQAPARPEPPVPAVNAAEQREVIAQERRRLLARRAALLEQASDSGSGLLGIPGLGPAPQTTPSPRLESLDRDLAELERREENLRAEVFRAQAKSATASPPTVFEAAVETDAISLVRIAILGEGQLLLRGPLAKVNALTRTIHEIDQPVGQVKIGIHVAQFTGSEASLSKSVQGGIDRYLGHARQMSQVSQVLFRTALSNVAARYNARYRERFEEAFFYAPCVRGFRNLHGAGAPLSIALLDSRDIVTTLYLASLTNNEARREILSEFRRLAAAEMPPLHAQYLQSLAAARKGAHKPDSFLSLGGNEPHHHDPRYDRAPDLAFARTLACLDSFSEQANSATAIQVATTRFQRAVLEQRRGEAAVTAMRNDRLLISFRRGRRILPAGYQAGPTDLLDEAAFSQLADHVIEQQAARVLDLGEVVRAEVATLDGHLKRLTTAFEDDLRRQFYWPVLEDLRCDCDASRTHMGQVQTTTIRTNDRTLARVSPSQTAVLERAVRPVLLQEGLQVAHGLAQEGRSLAQYAGAHAVSEAAAPGSSALLASAGLTPVPGQHLGQLAAETERTTVSVGDDISVTPVIQPDGSSVAFHLVYTHTPERNTEGQTGAAPGVKRHLVETDVHMPSLELQEVSRFRLSLESAESGDGVPLLEDLPIVGVLFRPRRSEATTVQENVILVEAVVYPTAMSLAGNSWLALESEAGEAGAHSVLSSCRDELSEWVLQRLRRQSQASLWPDGVDSQLAVPSEPPPGYGERGVRR